VTETFLYVEEFCAPAELDQLRSYAVSQEEHFVDSQVTSGDDDGRRDEDYRRSRVLYDIAEVLPFVTDRVMSCLPFVMGRLRQPMFDVREIELQVTVSRDGEWFRAHRDSGHGAAGSRALTFVYYCHQEPRPFGGGELQIFGDYDDAADAGARRDRVVVAPAPNSIVFFPSHLLHEVLPVSCPSGRFEDGRLTYNGWLHR
jgi:Rps23 Pro-64 3,4-dihydroxylase Tpa1-like proline 4-hydroxylase